MKSLGFWTVITIASIAFAISILMFCWTLWGQLFRFELPIDSNRFSDFGTFIGGIFGTLSFILLYFTLRETKNQSAENSFFNYLQLHDSLAHQLNSNEKVVSTLNGEYKELFDGDLCNRVDPSLKKECSDFAKKSHDGFFEALYAMLHVRYKYKGENPWLFFAANNWRMGHFIDSFVSVIELINENDLDKSKKNLYTRVFKSRSTSDELRLLFYFVAFNDDESKKVRLARLFKSVNFFDVMRDGLIKDGDMQVFKSIKT
jgi:hypothetical protein